LTSVLNPVITAGLSHNGRSPDMRHEDGQPAPDETVPVFGSWRAIYAAVAVSALAVMLLLALFSAWPF
jgi:hypothetical protein